ncbi:hypothetical protein SAMN04490357_3188 [Streptomyces misionensis]|uniref:Uncharacterized protein n=1 Tax=Streptomyces misionensis TaxID=67331 RepID=A0A1H4W8D0_9ACTN|nr:hypothetical protein [Streptomyces misionensis]SEC89567.1 hypothetical protein SAMN04490357_3188 [Streptomyces misionensis]
MPGPRTDEEPAAPDSASELIRWAAFSCVLVPVVLVWYGTSLAGATGTALGLAAVTAVCRLLLRRSERGARGARGTRGARAGRGVRGGRRARGARGARRGADGAGGGHGRGARHGGARGADRSGVQRGGRHTRERTPVD